MADASNGFFGVKYFWLSFALFCAVFYLIELTLFRSTLQYVKKVANKNQKTLVLLGIALQRLNMKCLSFEWVENQERKTPLFSAKLFRKPNRTKVSFPKTVSTTLCNKQQFIFRYLFRTMKQWYITWLCIHSKIGIKYAQLKMCRNITNIYRMMWLIQNEFQNVGGGASCVFSGESCSLI